MSGGRAAFLSASAGVACAIALVPAAFVAPVYRGESVSSDGATMSATNTLVGVNGLWVVWLLCIPVVIALTAWVALRLRRSRGGVLGGPLAWSSVALLWAFALIGSASVGLYVAPAALLLTFAASRRPS